MIWGSRRADDIKSSACGVMGFGVKEAFVEGGDSSERGLIKRMIKAR